MSVQFPGLLENGEYNLTNTSRDVIKQRVYQRLPPHTYNSIYVRSIEWTFSTSVHPLRAKMITIKRTTLSNTREIITALYFSVFGYVQQVNIRYDNRAVNLNNIIDYFLIGPTLEREAEVRKAYFNGKSITIFISDDCKHSYPDVGEQPIGIRLAITVADLHSAIRKLFYKRIRSNQLLLTSG